MNPEEVCTAAFHDEMTKMAFPKALQQVAGKMFAGTEKLVGQGLPRAMKASIPSRVPRPGQLSGKLTPPASAPRPAPVPKAPINWQQGNYDFSGR